MGLSIFFNATIRRAEMSQVVAAISVASGSTYIAIEKQHQIAGVKGKDYTILKDMCLMPDISIWTEKEEEPNDEYSKGLIVHINASAGIPDISHFDFLVEAMKLLGGCSYNISSEFNVEDSISETIEKFHDTKKIETIYKNYLGVNFLYGTPTLCQVTAPILECGNLCPYDDIREIFDIIDFSINKKIEENKSKWAKEWKPEIYNGFNGATKYDYFGRKTNVVLFLSFLLNKYNLSGIDGLKSITIDHIKDYINLIEKTLPNPQDVKKYTMGIMVLLREFANPIELAKLVS